MVNKIIRRIRASEMLVNVSKLATGTAVAQFFSIATAPILYRIYDKEDYGTLALYMAITGVIGVFSTLQYLQSILLEKDDVIAINAMWLNRVINIGCSILTFFLLLAFYPLIIQLVNNTLINKWLWFIPISMFFGGQNEIFRMWANRKKEYNLLTLNAIFMSVLTPIISIAMGLTFNNETGLFLGLLVGQPIPALLLFIGIRKKYHLGLSNVTYEKIKYIARQHNELPIYSLPSEFIYKFTNHLPVFMINSIFGPASVGVYNLTVRMLGLPIQFIGEALGTVFQQRATEDYNIFGSCSNIFMKTFKILLLVSILPTISILFFGPSLFELFFGENWHEAGVLAQILIVMMMLKLIVSPLSYTFFIAGKLKLDFIFHVGILVITSSLLYIGLSFFSFKVGLLFFGISNSFFYLIYLFFSYKYSEPEKK